MPPSRIPKTMPALRRSSKHERRNSGHLAFIRLLPCVGCEANAPCQAAHVRMNSAEHKTYNTMGRKPLDRFSVPLCATCHLIDQHSKEGERPFWSRLGIDPLDLASRLWAVSGDLDEGRRAVFRARQAIQLRAERASAKI